MELTESARFQLIAILSCSSSVAMGLSLCPAPQPHAGFTQWVKPREAFQEWLMPSWVHAHEGQTHAGLTRSVITAQGCG